MALGLLTSTPCGYPGQIDAKFYFSKRPGVIGCYFSHLKALEAFHRHHMQQRQHLHSKSCPFHLTNGYEENNAAVIFEDDILPKPSFISVLDSLIPRFPLGWDIILLYVKSNRFFNNQRACLKTVTTANTNTTNGDTVEIHDENINDYYDNNASVRSGDVGLRTWSSVLCPSFNVCGSQSDPAPLFQKMPFCVPASSAYIIRSAAVLRTLHEAVLPMITEFDGLLGLLVSQ